MTNRSGVSDLNKQSGKKLSVGQYLIFERHFVASVLRGTWSHRVNIELFSSVAERKLHAGEKIHATESGETILKNRLCAYVPGYL